MNRRENKKSLNEIIWRAVGREDMKFDFGKWQLEHEREIGEFQARAKGPAAESSFLVNAWRIIMKSTIAKLAVAAVIVFVVGVSIAVLNGSDDSGGGVIGGAVVTEDATKLEAELEKVAQLYASGDIKGLVGVLAGDEYAYESKVAAAKFLADIGDDSAIAELQKLSDEQIGEGGTNPFAEAILAIRTKTEGAAGEGSEAPVAGESEAPAAGSETEAVAVVGDSAVKKVGDELLQLLPTDSLFCLRVNNFDSAVGTMDQYLAGVSPIPVGMSMLARMQLAGLVGDPALNNINTQGNFAVFGVGLPGQAGDMFIAALLPVSDYTKLVSENQNYSEPDANGISVIKVGGTVDPSKMKLAVRVGGYILVSSKSNYDNLVSMAKQLAGGATGFGASLKADEVKAAMAEPIWAYCNIQRASKVYGSIIIARLEEVKKQLEKMNESGQGGPPPAAIMNFYFGFLDIIMTEEEFFTIALRPQAQVCNITISTTTIPDTPMAKMFGTAISDGTENKLLGYLKDGAIFNIAIKKNTAFWEEYSLSQYDILSFLSEEGIDDETIGKLEKTISELIASAGSCGAISFSYNNQEQESMPLALRYILEVKDAHRWDKAIVDAMDVWNTAAGSLSAMGIESKYEIEQAVDTYKDVSISGATCTMKVTNPNSGYGKMMDQIYSGGLNYRFAVVDDLWLSVLDSNSDSAIRQLIDEAQADGPKETAPEFAAALLLITEPEKSDFVGTVNIVRYMNMAGAMAQAMGTEATHMAFVMPKIDAPTNSNIAFAGKVGGGTMVFEIALPKDHLLEIKAAGEMLAQKMLEAQQQAKAAKEAESQAQEANSPGEVNDVNAPGESSE